MMGECLYVWEYSSGCENNKAAEKKLSSGADVKRSASGVTCGAERDERQCVFADHRQLIFGKGQPAYDVLYEIVGDD